MLLKTFWLINLRLMVRVPYSPYSKIAFIGEIEDLPATPTSKL